MASVPPEPTQEFVEVSPLAVSVPSDVVTPELPRRARRILVPAVRTSSADNILVKSYEAREEHARECCLKQDRYEKIKPIGEGATGCVYEAYDSTTGRSVALKEIERTSQTSYLLIETVVGRWLKHPGIARLLDTYWTDGKMCIVSELVCGTDLFDWITAVYWSKGKRNRRIPEDTVAEVIQQVTDAIVYLHDNAVAHRDLKPENVMVVLHPTRAPVIKIIDLGLAYASVLPPPAISNGSAVSRSDSHLVLEHRGSLPCYCGPEVLVPGSAVDPFKTDVWAVGVLTHIVSTGGLPYSFKAEAYRYSAVALQAITQLTPEDFADDPYLTEVQIDFIISAMQVDPQTRPTARQLADHDWLYVVFDDSFGSDEA